jgi:hypothetical protein
MGAMAARGISTPVFSTDSERTLYQIGHNNDALRFIE